MNVFDIIGPVMIGPSSSHTAGAVRIGRIAGALLGEAPVKAEIGLHGSFAKTYKGHGTDKALAAGIMGMEPSDGRIRQSLQLAAERGMEISFYETHIDGAHPNTALIALTGTSGKTVLLEGASIGGGNIRIRKVNGMGVDVSGEATTFIILHNDTPGTIAAVTQFLAGQNINIGSFRLNRRQKGGLAVMTLEVDSPVTAQLNRALEQLPNIISSTVLAPQ
ncbi:MAG: L-serine ammonia-lyase, iron-sulfur-dependent subunit beta [Oscillospiraceae bacterium]|nr:L-serine ammonia-lyase, iron-sulfur-dependent subunit beta [Oscillospiraceae bacterium]